jgi:uncharacterized protein YaiI (UPF0178 family)
MRCRECWDKMYHGRWAHGLSKRVECVQHSGQANAGTMTEDAPKPTEIYVDADACPVKAEVYRVAERHGLKVFVVSNSPINVPREPWIERVVVGSRMDEADDWIAERAGPGDIVITADVPLASRGVKAGAAVIAPNGKAFDEDSIGMQLATRNLLHELRGAGEITGGPKPFAPRDRSEFLSALDRAIVRIKRRNTPR